MNILDVDLFYCLSCKKDIALKVFERAERNRDNVKEGVFFCPSCKTFYPILEGIPFFLDKSYYEHFKIQDFLKKWQKMFNFSDYKLLSRGLANSRKLNQVNFFDDDLNSYDDTVTNSTFWRANDWNTIRRWANALSDDSIVLDIGCGTGRCTVPLAQKCKRVIGADISFGMLQKAVIKSRAAGVNNITYLLADAEELPLREGIFSVVVSFGALHHVDDPARVVLNVEKLLKSKGIFYAEENNASPLLPIFRFLMKIHKLWNEEAGTRPVFKRRLMESIISDRGMYPHIYTSIFLPPHLFNLMGYNIAKRILFMTDKIFNRIPGVSDFGGQLVVKATKY